MAAAATVAAYGAQAGARAVVNARARGNSTRSMPAAPTTRPAAPAAVQQRLSATAPTRQEPKEICKVSQRSGGLDDAVSGIDSKRILRKFMVTGDGSLSFWYSKRATKSARR